MSRRMRPWLLAGVLGVVLAAYLGINACVDQNGPQWRSGIEMMKILPADVSLVEYFDFSGRFAAAEGRSRVRGTR